CACVTSGRAERIWLWWLFALAFVWNRQSASCRNQSFTRCHLVEAPREKLLRRFNSYDFCHVYDVVCHVPASDIQMVMDGKRGKCIAVYPWGNYLCFCSLDCVDSVLGDDPEDRL